MSASEKVHLAITQYLEAHDSVISSLAAQELAETIPSDTLERWLWDRRYEFLGELVSSLSRSLAVQKAHSRRSEIFASASGRLSAALQGDQPEAVQEFFRMWQCGLRDGQPVRKRLGDMTREELRFHRERQTTLATTYARRVRFLEHVEARLAEGQTVGAVFTPDQLEELLSSIH